MSQLHPIPDQALESDIAILGKKGRGKSYTARGIVERLLGMGRRVVVLDPLSTWWGLAAGDAGFPVAVLGGPHGDLPLTDADGEALGRHLAVAEISAVLDLGHMRKAEMIRFAAAFLEELYTHNRSALWLVLEEADVFAPQNPGADTARLYGEVDRIARRGRQFGFRLITLTQRPARLAKDVLTQLSTLVALGITSPQDRDAIRAWVDGNADRDRSKEVVDTLASLRVGEGWIWSPDNDLLERGTFPPNRTPDTSATPQAGERRPEARITAGVDVAAIRAAIGAAVHDGTHNSNKSGVNSHKRPADAAAIAEAEERGFRRGLQQGQLLGVGRVQDELRAFVRSVDWIGRDLASGGELPVPAGAPLPMSPEGKPAAIAPTAVRPREVRPGKAASDRLERERDTAGLNSAGRKMLAVLDTNPPVRRTWRQVATLAGLKASGGHFNAGRKGLIDQAWVEDEGGLVAIRTAKTSAPPPVTDRAELVLMWSEVLTGAAPKILLYLAGLILGSSCSRNEVAQALGLKASGGHWNAAWKELRDNGLIEERAGAVQLSSMFREA